MVRVIFMLIRALRRKWLRRDVMARDHSGYGLGQWGKALHSNASFWYCIVRPAFNGWAHVQEWPLLKIVNDDALNPQVLHIISDAIMGAVLYQITSLAIVYSTVYSGTDKKTHQNSTSLAFVRGIQRWPIYSPPNWPVARKLFPFDDVIVFILNRGWLIVPFTRGSSLDRASMIAPKLKQVLKSSVLIQPELSENKCGSVKLWNRLFTIWTRRTIKKHGHKSKCDLDLPLA